MISNKKDFTKKLNTLLYSFVWKGNDKVIRTVLIGPIKKGGLKMPDLDSKIAAQRIICIEKYPATTTASRKSSFWNLIKRMREENSCFNVILIIQI